MAQRVLDAGLLDGIRGNLVPVLLGAGIPLFEGLSSAAVVLEDPLVTEGTGVEFETGNLTLQVIDCAKIGREFQPTPPIALHVEDVDAARAELESRGVEFAAQFDSGVCHQAIFFDPDGNTLDLHHRYAPKQPA